MKATLIKDWREYCDGNLDVEVSHFNTLFMSELGPSELKEVLSPFANRSELIDNISMLWREGVQVSDQERRERVIDLAVSDIAEKTPIIEKEGEDRLLSILNEAKFKFVDMKRFAATFRGDATAGLFIEVIGDRVLYELLPRDRNVIALFSVLYHFGNSLELRWSLISPLFKDSAYRFRSFLNMWSLGGRYAVTENGILVSSEERGKMSKE